MGKGFAVFPLLAICILCACRSEVQPFQPNVSTGGRAVSIGVNPTNGQNMIVASETGGLFRTSDGGSHWQHLDGLLNVGANDVAFDPSGNIVIASAGADFQVQDHGFIWRSTDGGNTWSQPVSALPPPGPRCPPRPNAYSVTFEPGTQNVYVATDCGLASSQDSGATWSMVVIDQQVLSQNTVHTVLAAAGGQVNVATDNGLYASPNRGQMWNRATNGPPFGGSNHSFAASPYNSSHVFYATQVWNGQTWVYQLWVSIDGGIGWQSVPIPSGGWSRAPFVRIAKSTLAQPNLFDLYLGLGDGGFLKAVFTDSTAGPSLQTPFQGLMSDHADFNDVAFDPSGTIPVLLATDGGVHKTSNKGASWTLAGAGPGGYNALQMTEVTGQAVSGQNPHQDLYYGTQDNSILASSDGGLTWPTNLCWEGYFLRTPPTSVDHIVAGATAKVTGAAPNCTSPWLADFHLTNVTQWPNPPNAGVSSPFMLAPGAYVQATVVPQSGQCSGQANVNQFVLTPNTGQMWSNAFTVCQDVWGIPVVAGPPSNPTVYQGVRRPGQTSGGQPRIGLVKITNLFGPGPAVVTDADVQGFGSLGVFPTMFAWYMVFGVDQQNPDSLRIADIDTNQMKFSLDGGQSWHVDNTLTPAVTSNGTFEFVLGQRPIVDVIAFDPFGHCLGLVGTAQNGVVRTRDYGRSWTSIHGSDQLSSLSSFYFPPTGTIFTSTYGRGLWKLNIKRGTERCPPVTVPEEHYAPPTIIDPLSGVRIPFHDIGDPTVCGACQYVLVANGSITYLQMNGLQVQQILMQGGSIYQFNSSKMEVPLQVPNSYASASGRTESNQVLQGVLRQGPPIRGIILEGTTLRGIITSDSGLAFKPKRIPYVRILNSSSFCGVGCTTSGGTVTIAGEGFATGAPVRVQVGGQLVADHVKVDESGSFRVLLQTNRLPGDYDVFVEQQEGKRVSMDHTKLKVVVAGRKH